MIRIHKIDKIRTKPHLHPARDAKKLQTFFGKKTKPPNYSPGLGGGSKGGFLLGLINSG
jgi:hypothetical protein